VERVKGTLDLGNSEVLRSVCIDLRLNARIFDQIPVVGQKVNAVVTPEQQYVSGPRNQCHI
jgi:hypothetical protein